jgi:class 3 adenylate cyclase
MAEERLQRRLAAILSADVVGYSRLMGFDEAGTLSRLNALRRELINPTIAAHSGRIVKLMGDGALVEFASAVDAVTCAIEIQRQVREHDAGGSEANAIQIRIGINVGDIIIEGGDILGDGVNIAARIEGIAEPGGISISEDAWRQVQGKVAANFVDAGEQSLKNIARPVRVYRLDLAPKATTASEAPRPMFAQSDKPWIGNDVLADTVGKILLLGISALFLRARELLWHITRSGSIEARNLLGRAVAISPDFAAAHSLIGSTHVHDYANCWAEIPEQSLKTGLEIGERAVQLDEEEPQAHDALAIALFFHRELDRALAEARRCLALAPNWAGGHLVMARILTYSGDAAAAINMIDAYMRLDVGARGELIHSINILGLVVDQPRPAIRVK